MPRTKVTSLRIARLAGQALRSRATSRTTKRLAGSALAQAKSRRKGR